MSKQKQEWDSSAYLKRKEKREAEIEPQWVTNPETGEKFCVRQFNSTPFYVASNVAADGLRNEILAAWLDAGIEIPTGENGDGDKGAASSVSEGKRDAILMGKTVMRACVIPKIVLSKPKAGEIHLAQLHESDLSFVYRTALGITPDSKVKLQGGESMKVQDLKRVSGKPGKRSGTLARG